MDLKEYLGSITDQFQELDIDSFGDLVINLKPITKLFMHSADEFTGYSNKQKHDFVVTAVVYIQQTYFNIKFLPDWLEKIFVKATVSGIIKGLYVQFFKK